MDPDLSQQPKAPTPPAGLAVLTILVITVAVILSRAQPNGRVEAPFVESPAVASLIEVPGFRSDAWFLPDDRLLGFVEVPAGPFSMGSDRELDREAFDNERWSAQTPQGRITLPAYFIGRYEVTIAQFAAFVEATGFNANDQTLRGPPDHPVANISWPDALAYSRWLNDTLRHSESTPTQLQERLDSGWEITLPSEPQWEKAARGSDSRIYPWGNTVDSGRANYGTDSTQPVGSYPCPECPLGLLDLSGNVWEWTRSPYQPYPFDPSDDREELDRDALWIIRGGSFIDPSRNIRAAVRGGGDPGARRPFIGFRLVITAP